MQGIFNAADIGSQVREKRLAQGMNQTVLAQKLGCSRKWVSDIEQGNETAEIGRVLRALAMLGIKIFVGQSEAVESKEISPQYNEILAHRDQFGEVPQAMERIAKLGLVGNPMKENLERTIGPKLLPVQLPEAFKHEGQPSAATTEEVSATKPQLPKPGDGEDD
ncbi:helix-turn-helix domain-containing protein [Swingsia samuiensis]|uniref:Transcriptional regulator n=1 Tax=Swingsia samuiensis TaxID=1293412 RepID=A0A4Y6UP30_9PROT|nr:helix-turn-helix domain-containing protein [Swingsia samuiensis]QDH18101.1 transcriptional regulator [Swingsia samuiensis]